MQKTIRIGTRDSQLALWQANKVRKQLEELELTVSGIKNFRFLGLTSKVIYDIL